MWTTFRYMLSRLAGQIVGWGLGLAILAVYVVSLYPTFSAQSETFGSLIEAYPPELMAMFGGTADLFSPPGYLNFTFYSYMNLVLGIFVILTGSGLLVSDEESGRLDLIMAYPISRFSLFLGRLTAFFVSILLILFITWVGFLVLLPGSNLDLNAWQVALPLLDLFAVLILFAGLTIFLSLLLPSRRLAVMIASLFLVVSFFISTLVRLDESLKQINRFNPLHYSKGGYTVESLNGVWISGLIGFGLLFALLAAWRFQRRDIRVVGEGSWGVLSIFRRGRSSRTAQL
jgi:ABC-2 type transport system permease protein